MAESRAEDSYAKAKQRYQENLRAYQEQESTLRREYDKEKTAFEKNARQRNLEVDNLELGYSSGDADAVVTFCTMVLERSKYPDDFPQEFRMVYLPPSRELVIDYDLPTVDIIPSVVEHRYVRSKDEIQEKLRKAVEIKEAYQDVVASVALRTIHEILKTDRGHNIDVVVFSGFVHAIDPATGKQIRPCLLSVRTTRDRFQDLNLALVDKKVCLRNLGAQVSPRPDEMLAVKPVVDFDMVDKRFVDQTEVLDGLDARPNLMELNPFEFENLVSNLFSRMGFETKQTRSSRDGGVDAVAFDARPIVGGKVVIQAKRYSNVVGVSAVRDLYGTMMNEGANKGILVATSHYGADAYDFARDKPVELIDGGGLLHLLEQNDVKARIVFLNENSA